MFMSLCIPAFSANVMTISIPNTIAKVGEEVTIDVILENNPGINYLKLKVEYSPYMTITSVKDGKLFEFMRPVPGNKDSNPYVYVYSAAENEYYAGKMFSITFKVSDDAPIKDHFAAVSVVQCLNQANEDVEVNTVSGMISVINNDIHVHSYNSSVTSATCTEKGYTTYTCECGDTYKENYVDATGHTPEVVPGKPATETETGLTDGEKCTVCGVITKEQSEIPVIEHKHNYVSNVTEPTCSEKGFTTYTCSCGDSYTDNYVSATGNHVDNDSNYKCDYCETDLPRLPVTGGDDNKDYSLGDINDDDKITAADARIILRTAARLETLTEIQMLAADIDGNGKVTASDARVALRISAKLDSIDNYIKEEPPVEEPPVEEPENSYDLSGFFGVNGDTLTAEFPEFVFEDGHAGADGAAIDISDDGFIYDISVFDSGKFNIYGINSNTELSEAITKLEEAGFVMTDESFGYNEETGINVCVFENEEGLLFVNIYIDDPDNSDVDYEFSTDMGYNISMHIDIFLECVDSLVQDEDDEYIYYNNSVTLYTDSDGYVNDIYITDECEYTIYGVGYGTAVSDVDGYLTDAGFVYDEEYMVWYNEEYNEYVSVEYDNDNEYVVMINIWNVEATAFDEYELFQYMDGPLENVTDVFDELEYFPETDDTYEYYWHNGIYFYPDESGYITSVELDESNDYTLWGLYVGMAHEDAVESLEYAGECYYDAEQYIVIDNYHIGISGIVTFDEDGFVDFISVFDYSYNMVEYLDCDIEMIMSAMPYVIEDEENIYLTDCFAFYVDENGYVTEVAVISYSYCYIYDVYLGMLDTDAIEVLESYGFEYDSTDEDGFDYYYNSDEEITVCLYLDEFDEVSFVSAIC